MSSRPAEPRARRRMLLLAPLLTVSVLAVAVLGFALIRGVVEAQEFKPQVNAELSDDEVSVNADLNTLFKISSESMQYQRFFSFTPEEFFPLDRAVDPAIGTDTGIIKAKATLGLLNGACGTLLPVTINLDWCSTNTSDTLANFDDQFVDTSPANGIPDGCDHYPEFLTRIIPGLEPIERHFGWVNVSGQKVSLSIAYFEPGSLGFDEEWGMVGVTVLNDIGDTAGVPTPDAITDFCAPLETEIILNGLAGDGAEVRRNPSCSDTFSFRWHAESFPYFDDGDPYENYLDTCPYCENTDPSPKTGAGDPDGDGIDACCEEPLGGVGVGCWPGAPGPNDDCDNDGYQNRGDNCPLDANGNKPGQDNQADEDGDHVGDECDDPAFKPERIVVRGTQLQVDVDITGGSPCSAATPTPAATVVGTETPTPTPTAGVTLAAAVAAGANQITVTDASGFAVGDSVTIGSGDTAETCEITAISDSTLTLDCTLEFDHAAGEAVVKVAEATPTATPPPGPEGICGFVFPATYNGLARLNGVPASGYVVTVKVGGEDWGSAVVTGGRYAVDVPSHAPATPPCFPPEAGTAIAFEINGATCTTTPETTTWSSGLHDVDLNCAAAPVPGTPVPGTPVPGTPAPGTPVKTPTPAAPPPSGGGGLGGDQGLPLWAMVLAGWAGLTAMAGLGTLATRIVKR